MISWLRRKFIGNRNPLVQVAIFLLILLVAMTAGYIITRLATPRVMLKLGDGVFTTTISRTNDEIEKGLSGTAPLEPNQAMLFVFDHSDKWGIWMKGMQYPIDIVWLDENKEVVQIIHHADPATYPQQKFIPAKAARYVVELPADTAKLKAISIGSQAIFDDNLVKADDK